MGLAELTKLSPNSSPTRVVSGARDGRWVVALRRTETSGGGRAVVAQGRPATFQRGADLRVAGGR
jgi:hypothetical protein